MTINFLDRPVWNALSGRQADVAIGGDRARRFDPTINILAGVRDDSSLSLHELAGLVPAEGTLILLEAGESPSLPAEVVDHVDCGVQMVADRLIEPPADVQPVPLDENDAAAMLDLASLTEPGPFLHRTHVLGPFVGIKVGGQLVAMAGERLRLRGYSEVSGVCTHPDFRGRGFARILSQFVAARIQARGEKPFLHSYAGNEGAIQLYRSLGFKLRVRMSVTVLRRT